jgi:hypothetical protein
VVVEGKKTAEREVGTTMMSLYLSGVQSVAANSYDNFPSVDRYHTFKPNTGFDINIFFGFANELFSFLRTNTQSQINCPSENERWRIVFARAQPYFMSQENCNFRSIFGERIFSSLFAANCFYEGQKMNKLLIN